MNKYQDFGILLVEDSPQDAEIALHALKRSGIINNISWVKDGVEALDYLACEGAYAGRDNGMPKLILLDLKMPRMDGLQTLERLKGSAQTRAIPVVILTSSAEETDLIKSYSLGVNSYIVKPVDFSRFAEVVTQIGMYWVLTNHLPG